MPLFCPPGYLAAVAAAARGDADLPDGVHLRILPAPILGFPLMPFFVLRAVPSVVEPRVYWRDGTGRQLAQPSLDAAGGVLIGDIVPPSGRQDDRDLAVELIGDGSFTGSIALLDRVADRVFFERSHPPFIVGGPRVERVRITGHGQVWGVRTWRLGWDGVREAFGDGAVAMLGLPLSGSRPWYVGGRGPGPGFDQVERGAARRLQRPDRPDGPFDLLTPADDRARVGVDAPDLDADCELMVGDIARPPQWQRRKRGQPAASSSERDQFADIGVAGTLLVQGLDPGIGRYLGLVGTLDEHTDGSVPLAYVVIGAYAFFTGQRGPDGRRLDSALIEPMIDFSGLSPRLKELLQLGDIPDRLFRYYDRTIGHAVDRSSLQIVPLVTAAGAVPLADVPRLPTPAMGSAQWLPGGGRPSTEFRQQFIFPDSPLGALVALGRIEGGAWKTRHREVDLPAPANPPRRARAMLLGRTQPTPRDVGLLAISSSYLRRGLITDTEIRADAVAMRYRAALADLFGRYGPPAEFDVSPPPRPRPPAPVPRAEVVLDGPDGVGGPPASPGHVDVSVVVQSVADLAVGSLDIAMLRLQFDGRRPDDVPLGPIAAQATQTVTKTYILPPLDVGNTGTSLLTAKFTDTAGAESELVKISVAYADRRRPAVVPTGLGLIWTSRPGPSPEVELRLAWPASQGTRYRVYIADEKTLRVDGTTRAAVAVEGGRKDRLNELGGRNQFRLLTDPPIEATGPVAMLDERLPRALTTVQFVRVVPLTESGREAEFHRCGVVPVAVPTDRRPPPPRLSVAVDPDTGVAEISIVALGLDLVELEAAEPGLFTEPPDVGAGAPEFRLRRASGAVTEPIYAREIARGSLSVVRGDGEVTVGATIADPSALIPFVRYSYWAEVRMPHERRVTPDVVEVPPANGVRPVNPAQATDMPRPYSAPSAPVTALHLPPLPVPVPEDLAATVIAEAGMLRTRLTSSSTPSASPSATHYRLRLWEQWGDKQIGAATDVQLDGSPLDWEGTPVADDVEHPRPVTLRLVVIDPVGRESAMMTLSAP
jgi:hypothetical protein